MAKKPSPEGLVEPYDYGLPATGAKNTKAMVAAVKGICFTVGIEADAGRDIVVAADNCRFSQMEVQRGIMATGGATCAWPSAGTGNALLHLDGRRVRQRRAYRLNFVQKWCPQARNWEALQIASASKPRRLWPWSPRGSTCSRPSSKGRRRQVADSSRCKKQLANSEDAAEGVRAFVERRPAQFSGR